MDRVKLIQSLLRRSIGNRYLEIGAGDFSTYGAVQAQVKRVVDPFPMRTDVDGLFIGTSDEFFDQNEEELDVVFVDGLHHAEQCLRDINNSLKVSRFVIVHDVWPESEEQTVVPRGKQVQWVGGVFKAWAAVLQVTVHAVTYLDDWGLGVLDSEKAKGPFELDRMTKSLRLDAYRQIVALHPGTKR